MPLACMRRRAPRTHACCSTPIDYSTICSTSSKNVSGQMDESDQQPAPVEHSALEEVSNSSQVQVSLPTDGRLPMVGPTAEPMAAGEARGDDGASKLSDEELALLDAFHKSPLVPARWKS